MVGPIHIVTPRRVALTLIATGLVGILLVFALALTPKGPSPAQAVSVYIESLTNVPGLTQRIAPQRMAWMVITNHSSSNFRVIGWAAFVGPRSGTLRGKMPLDEDFTVFPLLRGWSSMRVLINAPTNTQPWSGTASLTRDVSLYRVGGNLLKSPFDVVKGTASLLMPRIGVENLYTSPTTD